MAPRAGRGRGRGRGRNAPTEPTFGEIGEFHLLAAYEAAAAARNASLAPLALPFTIVRDAPGRFRGGWAPSPLDGGLFADAALAADWARPPRAARALRCDPALVKQLG